MASRFFHALVVVGAAISASACGGKSESTSGDDGAGTGAGGGGGTTGGGAGGGTTGGSGTGATGGSSGGTAAGGTNGGTGGSVGGTGGTLVLGGTGGTQPTGPFPEPGPTAQWDCRGYVRGEPNDPVGPVHQGCVDALGVTAERLLQDCPVDPTFPKSAADCTSTALFTCNLAVTVDGVPVLVNCTCEERSEFGCNYCSSLDLRNGPPVSCTPELKICECAYTGILR